jgi:Outer membrane lipoprotein carrier protein LolA-like
MKRRVPALLLLLALLWSATASAQPATSEAWGLPQLMHEFGDIKQSVANYVERRYLSVVKTPIESRGVLVYIAPSYLEKETQTPEHEQLVVEGDRITIEKGGDRHSFSRDDYPQIWGFIEGIRSTLAGDLATLQSVYAVTLEGSDADWQMLLQPRDAKMQEMVQQIRFSGSGPHIKSVVTQERDGDRTEMSITERAP